MCRPGCTPSWPSRTCWTTPCELSVTRVWSQGLLGTTETSLEDFAGSALERVLYGETEGAAPEPCQGAREASSSPRGGSGVARRPQWERKAACDCSRPGPAGRAARVFEVGAGGCQEAGCIRLPLARAVAGAHASRGGD